MYHNIIIATLMTNDEKNLEKLKLPAKSGFLEFFLKFYSVKRTNMISSTSSIYDTNFSVHSLWFDRNSLGYRIINTIQFKKSVWLLPNLPFVGYGVFSSSVRERWLGRGKFWESRVHLHTSYRIVKFSQRVRTFFSSLLRVPLLHSTFMWNGLFKMVFV